MNNVPTATTDADRARIRLMVPELLQSLRSVRKDKDIVGRFLKPEARMGKTLNSNHSLAGHITRALNKIRKPSTAEEITDLLNSELDSGDRGFQAKEVTEWLRNASDTTVTLYWLRTRPRK
jgi:hypothetical protein